MGYVAHAVSVFFFISCCVYSILLYYLAHASRRVRGELFFVLVIYSICGTDSRRISRIETLSLALTVALTSYCGTDFLL